jgi:hypothetical protein
VKVEGTVKGLQFWFRPRFEDFGSIKTSGSFETR